MTSRGMISARQRTNSYRPDGAIAPHVLASTMEIAGATFEVKGATAAQPMQVGRLSIEAGTHFYFIRSRFGRYYLITDDGQCSSPDERTCGMCAAKLVMHLDKARKLHAA